MNKKYIIVFIKNIYAMIKFLTLKNDEVNTL